MTSIQLHSAINYKACEEKKEFKLVSQADINIQAQTSNKESDGGSRKKSAKSKDSFEDQQIVEETEDIVLVDPEHLRSIND